MKTLTSKSLTVACAPHQHSHNHSPTIMLWVAAACLPALLLSTWFFGIGTALNIVLAACFAISLEAAALKLQQRDWRSASRDNSALLTALLLGLAMPPGSPWWLVLLGIAFAILIAKQAFGGLGQNTFNPAMCGYAMLLLSFPEQMTVWYLPITDAGNAIAAALNTTTNLFDRNAGTGWEIINIAFLLGGLLLLQKRIISWHIPFSIITTVAVMAMLFYSEGNLSATGTPYLHLFGSATMMVAFLIATDPVSAASTALGKVIYGVIIGVVIYSIRVWGSYPDSIAFAVLFGNLCAPLIDHLTVPRIYGQSSRVRLWK